MHCVITQMTGEVYGPWDYIFKAQPAFLASFRSPHQSGKEKWEGRHWSGIGGRFTPVERAARPSSRNLQRDKKRGCRRGEASTPLRERQRGQCLPASIIDGRRTPSYPASVGPTPRWGKFRMTRLTDDPVAPTTFLRPSCPNAWGVPRMVRRSTIPGGTPLPTLGCRRSIPCCAYTLFLCRRTKRSCQPYQTFRREQPE